MKKIKSVMLVTATTVLLLLAFCFSASAAEWIDLNETAQYSFDEDTGIMIIRGENGKINAHDFAVYCNNHCYEDCDCLNEIYYDFSDEQYAANNVAKKVKTLIVQEGVTKLGTGVFTGFNKVEIVILPQSITEIPDGAFYFLKKLRTVVLPDTIVSVGDGAFARCAGLQHLYLPDGVKKLGSGAFYGCEPDVIRIPETVEEKAKVLFVPELHSFSVYSTGTLYADPDEGGIKEIREEKGVELYTYDKVSKKYKTIGSTSEKEEQMFGPYVFSPKKTVGEVYNFACRTYLVVNGKKIYSDYYHADEYVCRPGSPSLTEYETTTTSIKLSWSAVNGADGYKIFYKVNGKWKACATVATTSHTFKNLKAGAKYTFAIQSFVKIDGKVIYGGYTEYTTATKPATVTAKATSSSKGKISLSWNQVSGSEGYQIWYKKGDGNYKLYKTVGAGTKSMSFSNLTSGTKYTFAVRAGIKTSGGNIYGSYKTAAITVK